MNHDETRSGNRAKGALSRILSRANPAAVVRSLAGAAGAWRRSRRGSVLILVVGTLALLTVISVVYVTIGRGDRQAAGAMVRYNQQQDLPRIAADYFAQVIGDDVLSVYQPRPGALNPWVREVTDYPSISYDVRSDVTDPSDDRYYWPTGMRTGRDPYLASNEPVWLNFQGNAPNPNFSPAQYAQDWANITNIAPDGRFVNLHNLRNNFDASPLDLSTNLFLMTAAGGPTFTTDFGAPVDLEVPAHWSARQVNMFHPLNNGRPAPVGTYAYLPYSFADADGDGFIDSRWFELVDARLPSDRWADILPRDERYRYFFAVRIIDLSGMINVNTATEFVNRDAATGAVLSNTEFARAPVGLTPGDVDLRTRLSMFNESSIYWYNSEPAIYNYLYLPPNDPNDTAQPRIAENYLNYDPFNAFQVGIRAYEAIYQAISRASTPAPGVYYPNASGGNFTFLTPRERRDTYVLSSSRAYGASFQSGTMQTAGPFDESDLQELLTFFATNNPDMQSRLEAVTGGRYSSLPPGQNDTSTTRYDPLRSNRPATLERGSKVREGGTQVSVADLEAQTQAMVDVRHHLTTYSGARPLRATNVQVVITGNQMIVPGLSTSELKVNAPGALAAGNARMIFSAYADSLMADSRGAWPSSGGEAARRRTQFYGHRGPEFSLYVSAFLTVNMLDSFDADSRSRVATVLLDNAARGLLKQDYQNPASAPGGDPDDEAQQRVPKRYSQRTHPWAFWVENEGEKQLDLNNGRTSTARLADTNAGDFPPIVPAMNVYGVEAQPFIAEVATLTVYNDSPPSSRLPTSRGDNDEASDPDDPGPNEVVTINGTIDPSNSDFICRIIAFQLVNPFDTAITLGGYTGAATRFAVTAPGFPALDRAPEYYYIEFGGRLYMVAELVEQTYQRPGEGDAEYLNAGSPVVNPARAGPNNNDLPPAEYVDASPNQPYPFVTLRPITLAPGQSVVCYAISHGPRDVLLRMRDADRFLQQPENIPPFTDPSDLNAFIVVPNPANVKDRIHQWINAQFGSNVQRVAWVPRFDPDTGLAQFGFDRLLGDGRGQESAVNLWRAVRSAPSQLPGGTPDLGAGEEGDLEENFAFPATYWDYSTSATAADRRVDLHFRNNRENDQLVDRLHLGLANLNRKLPDGQNSISGAFAGRERDDPDPPRNYNSGITYGTFASLRRPNNPTGSLPRGAIPAYCIERRPTILTPTPWSRLENNSQTPDLSDVRTGSYGALTLRGFRGRVADPTNPNRVVYVPQNVIDTIVKKPEDKTGHSIGNNIAGVPFSQLYRQFYLNNQTFSDQNRSTLRVADMLLPLVIGPFETPLTYDRGIIYQSGPLNDPNRAADLNYRWTTLSEALAISFEYQQSTVDVSMDAPPWDWIANLYQQRLPGGRRAHDNGSLILDDFVTFYDVNTNGVFDPVAGDVRTGQGVPAALNILDAFSAHPAELADLRRAVPGLVNVNTAPVGVLRALPMLSPVADVDPSGRPWWWWSGGPLDEKSDIAATIFAYRDKLTADLRPQSIVPGVNSGVVVFSDYPARPDDPAQQDIRSLITGIDGIREAPGFTGVGELLTARDVTQPSGYANPSNIDFLGHPTPSGGRVNSSRAGVSSILYSDNTLADQIEGDFDQKLHVVNGVLNSVSARSDYFACWFLIHGYQRSDCTNLGPNEPMVPSIQRRFLMVVDRSNVTRLGEKPRIVLFKEMPR